MENIKKALEGLMELQKDIRCTEGLYLSDYEELGYLIFEIEQAVKNGETVISLKDWADLCSM